MSEERRRARQVGRPLGLDYDWPAGVGEPVLRSRRGGMLDPGHWLAHLPFLECVECSAEVYHREEGTRVGWVETGFYYKDPDLDPELDARSTHLHGPTVYCAGCWAAMRKCWPITDPSLFFNSGLHDPPGGTYDQSLFDLSSYREDYR